MQRSEGVRESGCRTPESWSHVESRICSIALFGIMVTARLRSFPRVTKPPVAHFPGSRSTAARGNVSDQLGWPIPDLWKFEESKVHTLGGRECEHW